MFYVRTVDEHATVAGRVQEKTGAINVTMTEAEAQADAAIRNKRAEELGIKTRYEAAEAS